MEVHELKQKVTKLEERQLLQFNWLSHLESLIQTQPATDIIQCIYECIYGLTNTRVT